MNRFRTPPVMYTSLSAVVLLLVIAFVFGGGWYVRWSDAHLPAMAENLGEVQMQRARRLEAAGALTEAFSLYQRALEGHFQGPQNRIHCEKRCGVILFKLGRNEAALPHLRRAQESPERSLNGFKPWAETLAALERWDEARAVVAMWKSHASGQPASRADACQVAGRIAMHTGQLAAAEAAFREALTLEALHASRADLATLLASRGNVVEAQKLMAAYLTSAQPGADTTTKWALLAEWVD